MADEVRAPDEVPLPVGYALVRKLGSGGSATVWLAEQGRLGRRVAIKVVGEAVGDAESRGRFIAESRAIGQLPGPPAVVTVHDAGLTDEGHPYLVMEHMPGGSLHDRLLERGPLPWAEVLEVGIHVADALSAAHAAGILHGDVRPANVLVDDTGAPKLGDFGIARLSGGTATATATPVGTVSSTAPEVLSGVPDGPSADVWALGALLYVLLTGGDPVPPGPAEPPAAAEADASPCAPEPLPPHVPADVAGLVHEVLRVEPAERPSSAADVARRLQALQRLYGLPVTTARATTQVVDADRDPAPPASVGFAPLAVGPGPPSSESDPRTTPADLPPGVDGPTQSARGRAVAPLGIAGPSGGRAAGSPPRRAEAALPRRVGRHRRPGAPHRRRVLVVVGSLVVLAVAAVAALVLAGGGDATDADAVTTTTDPPEGVPGRVDGIWGAVKMVPTGTTEEPTSVTQVVDVDCGGLLRCGADAFQGGAVVAYPDGAGLAVARVGADGSTAWTTLVDAPATDVAVATAGEVVLLVTTEDDPSSDAPDATLRTYRGLSADGTLLWGPRAFPSSLRIRRAADQALPTVSILTAALGETEQHPAGPGVIALDNTTGAVLWEASGQVLAMDLLRIYMAIDGSTRALLLTSGAEVWNQPVPVDRDGISPTHLGVGVGGADGVLVTVSDGEVIGLRLASGTPAWASVPISDDGVDLGEPVSMTLVSGAAMVTAEKGDLAVDRGGTVRWREARGPLLEGEGTPIWDGTADHLVAGRVGAPLHLLETTGDGAGDEVDAIELGPGPTTLSFLSFEGGVVVPTDDALTAYSTDDLTELWSVPDVAGVTTVVTVDGGVATLGSQGIVVRTAA